MFAAGAVAEHLAVAVFAEEPAQLLGPHLLVPAFDDGAFVHANANGNAAVFARIDDGFDLQQEYCVYAGE